MDLSEETIWKESFFKDNFNVDQCLSKYTVKSDLETLRSDLKHYGNELHQQMAEILKTETEAIVNLAEYLTNLNSRIDDLSLPISQLREEIKILHDLIKVARDSYSHTLDAIKKNNTQRNYLNLKSGIISSALYIYELIKTHQDDLCDSIIVERAVNKYSFEYNYLEAFQATADLNEISFVGKKLTELVNKIFLKALKHSEEDVILRCLRMYDNLGQQVEAENTYKVHIVRPALKHLFVESYLEACQQDLNQIYVEALQFIDVDMALLLDILKRSGELKSFNFILESYWVEVDNLSREGLPYITAPGNPELFQKRFKQTWDFLTQISKKCGNKNIIYTNASFQSHIKRFNLPVYFEIRFQQIAGAFESEAIIKSNYQEQVDENSLNCALKVTFALYKALLRTFDSTVFIDNLSDQFLRLSMLLLSRYLRWFDTALEECINTSDCTNSFENFVINSINDLNIINNLIGAVTSLEQTIYNRMPHSAKTILVRVQEINSNIISQMIKKLQDRLITMKSNESFTHLQNVAAIPRLYRRTNRNAPKEASHYMVQAIDPIRKFHNKHQVMMKHELQIILDTVISNITKQYSTLVEDVLRSVCKTEESLRRLKNRNTHVMETSLEDLESDKMSDEMKIREQIKLDVCYFVDKTYPLAMTESKKRLDELKQQT